MSTKFINTVSVPPTALIKPIYDTQEIVQNQSEINFFPAVASKKIPRNNYVSNPLPGETVRRVVGLSFELVRQFTSLDADNSIDPVAIVNALKDASVILTADSNYKQFLRTTIDRHSNFSGTSIEGAHATALVGAAIQSATSKTAITKRSGIYFLADPFDIAPNQTIDLKVTFKDSSKFPTAAQWDASGQGRLNLMATLHVAEFEANSLN